MARPHSDSPIGQDLLAAIGRIAVEWTLLESAVAKCVWKFSGLQEEQGHAVTTHIPFLTLIDIAKTLGNNLLPGVPAEEKLRRHFDHIAHALRPKRNKVVHGLWGATSETTAMLLETTARGVLKMKVGDELTADDLLEIAREIHEAYQELIMLVIEFTDEVEKRWGR